MIEDVAEAAIEILAEAVVPDGHGRRRSRGRWWLIAAVIAVAVVAMIVIALGF